MGDIFDPRTNSMIDSTTLKRTQSYSNGQLTSITATNGLHTWVKTVTYNADGTINVISPYVFQS